ncbi:MAG: hypothetical protein Q9191_004512 [Dirinaria sp. TL-2023a]
MLSQIAFWTAHGVVDIVSELCLIGIPAYALWNIQTSRRRKAVVIECFAARLAVIGAIGAQLSQLSTLDDPMDLTHTSWRFYLCTKFVQDLSIITACIPYIRYILVGLESGMMQTGDFHLHKTTPAASSDQGSHSRSGGSHYGPTATTRARAADSIRRKNLEAENALSYRPGGLIVENTTRVEAFPPNEEIWERESQSSRADMITKTRGWKVEYHN